MKISTDAHEAIFNNNDSSSNDKVPKNPDDPNTPINNSHKKPEKEKPQPPPDPVVVVQSTHQDAHPVHASEVSKELLRIQGTWPFDLAPDELIIEDKRIIIKRNNFPVGGSVITALLKKVTALEVNHAVIYSALYIKGEGVNTVMQWLQPADALRAKEVFDGIRLQDSEEVEITDKNPTKVVETLQSIGRT